MERCGANGTQSREAAQVRSRQRCRAGRYEIVKDNANRNSGKGRPRGTKAGRNYKRRARSCLLRSAIIPAPNWVECITPAEDG